MKWLKTMLVAICHPIVFLEVLWERAHGKTAADYERAGRTLEEAEVYLTDLNVRRMEQEENDCCMAAIIGMAEGGPQGEPIIIGPTIDEPRWWQPWRWHLIPQYQRECAEATEKFIEHFGQPVDGGDLAAAVQFWANEPRDDDGKPASDILSKSGGE